MAQAPEADKFGPNRIGFGGCVGAAIALLRAPMHKLAGPLLILALALPSAAAARGGSVIAAGGTWAAVLRDNRCDAESRIVVRTARGKAAAIAGFAFAPEQRRWGAFHARLSRTPRAGASVMATIGRSQFLLVSSGVNAWSRDAAQDQAMLDAVRSSSGMKIESRDSAGRRFSDHYALEFAATAIDAAAARCAALQAGLQSGQKR